MLASPATRVAETLEEVAAGYGAGIAPVWEKRIYLASTADLLDVIHAAPAEADSLLLVGHNPGLEQLVLALVPARTEGPREQVEEKYPTASLAEIAFDADRWEDVAGGKGRLLRFVRPRDLDPQRGPEYA